MDFTALHAAPDPVAPDPPLHPRRTAVVGYRLHVALDEITPPIWRRLDVPSDLTLDRLHLVLQTVMGWANAHLHRFTRGDEYFGAPPGDRFGIDDGEGPDEVPENGVRLDEVLAAPGDSLAYVYDFGDGWEHTIALEEVVAVPDVAVRDLPAVLLDGERACPPEDCGGVPGYEDLVDTATALSRGESVEEWPAERHEIVFGDLAPDQVLASFDAFDVAQAQASLDGVTGAGLSAEVTALVRRARDLLPLQGLIGDIASTPVPELSADEVAAAVGPFRWFLEHVGDSVTLTSAGFLRPADVSAVAERLDLAREWGGTLNRESHTPQVTDFREAMQSLGLVRKAMGRLTPTAVGRRLVGRDPSALWEHLVERLPLVPRGQAASSGYDAAMVVLLRAAGSGFGVLDGGPDVRVPEPDPLLAQAFASLGWSLRSGEAVRSRDVRRLAGATQVVLERAGGYEPERSGWSGRSTPVGRALAGAVLGR